MRRIDVLVSPNVTAAIGNAATEREESRSAQILTARLPRWSTSQPPMGETTIAGSAETAATNPAKAGESVLSRINHGIVIITIELPSPDAKFEIWSRMTGDFFMALNLTLKECCINAT
jgi:hypothetical protein